MFDVVTEVDEHGGTLRLSDLQDQCPQDPSSSKGLGQAASQTRPVGGAFGESPTITGNQK
jgi:hypothetical protein